MKKEGQQDIKKRIHKTYGKIALQNDDSGSSCCAPGCCSTDSSAQTTSSVVRQAMKT